MEAICFQVEELIFHVQVNFTFASGGSMFPGSGRVVTGTRLGTVCFHPLV